MLPPYTSLYVLQMYVQFICIIENKCTNGKSYYLVTAPVLPSATDESVPLPINCETPSVKNGAI